MIVNETLLIELNSPVRQLKTRVELYSGSTLVSTFQHTDKIKSLTVERVGEGKFFGFGICHKANLKLLDSNGVSISTANTFKIAFSGATGSYSVLFPNFFVSEVRKDENTGELSITAYDAIYKANNHTSNELELTEYTLKSYATACASLLGLSIKLEDTTLFNLAYENGANLDGTETIREVLNAIAEATQTIYFVNSLNQLVFKRLDKDGEAVFTIDKEKYITLDSSTNRRLGTITNATELGDNVSASTAAAGTTQIIRDNPFLELREDIATVLDNAISTLGGLTINQFDCKWRGNPLIEIGDKINLITKENEEVSSFLLNDILTYDGSLSQTTKWKYEEQEETESNPTNLGDALKQTFARVDKANKEIELVASEANTNAENISSLLINTESISASVEAVRTETENAFGVLNENVSTLTNRVETAVSAEQVQLSIQTELAKGTSKVITETGFTFDEEGLTVSRTGSEMATQITDDGMTVSKDGEVMLTANNVGVNAVNLHATTYLIIGTNSRFENYGSNRTGCFWIGS